MQNIISICQYGISKHGLLDKTDITDWYVLDLIFNEQANEKSPKFAGMTSLEEKYLLKQLPLLSNKDRAEIISRINKLVDLGLLDVIICPNSKVPLFGKTTQLYFQITRFN